MWVGNFGMHTSKHSIVLIVCVFFFNVGLVFNEVVIGYWILF